MNTQDYPDINMTEKRLDELIKLVKAQSYMIEELTNKLNKIEQITQNQKSQNAPNRSYSIQKRNRHYCKENTEGEIYICHNFACF